LGVLRVLLISTTQIKLFFGFYIAALYGKDLIYCSIYTKSGLPSDVAGNLIFDETMRELTDHFNP
jgi:hypothetical protein